MHPIAAKVFRALKSRTVWVIASNFVLVGAQTLEPFLEPHQFLALITILNGLAILFKLNPSQNY